MTPYPEWHSLDDDSNWGPAELAQKKHHKKQHKRPDVAERGMDEEVHGFVKEAIPPLNTRVKSEDAFVPNGSDPSAHEGAAFSETKHHKKHKKRWGISDEGMDSYVHGFVNGALKDFDTEYRSPGYHIPNGSDPSAFEGSVPSEKTGFSEKKHHKKHHRRPDVAERGMDEEVHGFVKEAIPPLNT